MMDGWDQSTGGVMMKFPLDAQKRDLLVKIFCLYRDLLGRDPNPEGLWHHYEMAVRGRVLDDIADEFRSSPEYAERAARTDLSKHPEPTNPCIATGLDVLGLVFPSGVPLQNTSARAWWADEITAERHSLTEQSSTHAGGACVLFLLSVPKGGHEAAGITIASLLSQNDPRWRLVLATNWSEEVICRRHLGQSTQIGFVSLFPKIFLGMRLRRALRSSDDDLVCPIAAGDVVASSAVRDLLGQHEGTDFVTTDGGTVDEDGSPTTPIFSGACDPDAALARPPPGLVAARTRMVRRVSRPQDLLGQHGSWTLLLRATSAGRYDSVHVPAVLRQRPSNQSRGTGPLANISAGMLQSQLAKAGRPGRVVPGKRGSDPLRVVYPLPRPAPLVSVIVPTRDQPGLLKTCLDGLLTATDYESIEIIVVDNGSQSRAAHDLFSALGRDARVSIIRDERVFNWSALNLTGTNAAQGDILLFMNDDTSVIEASWLRELASQALRPDVGIVGAKLLYPSGQIQHAGLVFDEGSAWHAWRHASNEDPSYAGQLEMVRTVSAVTGACMAMRRGVYEEAGGFEQTHLAVTWGDVDMCFRVRKAGYRVVWTPHAVLYHHELATRGSDLTPENQARFQREHNYVRDTWGEIMLRELFFSPLLSPKQTEPTLKLNPDLSPIRYRSWT